MPECPCAARLAELEARVAALEAKPPPRDPASTTAARTDLATPRSGRVRCGFGITTLGGTDDHT